MAISKRRKRDIQGSPSFGVLIVRPDSNFTPRAGKVPKQWKGVRWGWRCHLEKDYATEEVAKYNAQALTRGWSTWAILWQDEAIQKRYDQLQAAEVWLDREDDYRQNGLSLFSGYLVRDGVWTLHMDLKCEPIKVRDGDDLRAKAIEQIENTLAAVKAAGAADRKPKRKRQTVAA